MGSASSGSLPGDAGPGVAPAGDVVVGADMARACGGTIMACSGAIRLNGIGFGTWAWGNQVVWGYDPQHDDGRLAATFQQALASGLTPVDTADSYGTGRLNGRSEALLGRFLSETTPSQRSGLVVCTKLAPFPWRLGRRGMDRAFEASRARLNGHIQRVQLHWSTARYAPWQESALLDGLADLVLQGQVRELGVSNVGPNRLAWMHKRLADRGVRLSSLQVQFSLLAPGDDRLRQVLARCQELQIDLLAYSPLALGVLCQPPQDEREPTTLIRRRLFRRLLPASRELRSVMDSIARDHNASMVQVALNWCRARGTTPIPGVRTPEQVNDVAAALAWTLSENDVNALDEARATCALRMPDNPFQSD